MKVKLASMTILATLVSVSCSKARNSGGGGGSIPTSEEASGDGTTTVDGSPAAKDPVVKPPVKIAAELPVRARVRNFEQFLYSMETVTGIKAGDATVVTTPANGAVAAVNHTINSVFLGNKDNLPGTSKVVETSPVNVKAYADVAAIYGRRLFLGTDAAAIAARAAFLGAEPTTPPDQFFTDAVIGDLIKKAWGGNVSAADLPGYVAIMKGLITDLKTNLPVADQTTVNGTRKLLVAALGVLAASDMVL